MYNHGRRKGFCKQKNTSGLVFVALACSARPRHALLAAPPNKYAPNVALALQPSIPVDPKYQRTPYFQFTPSCPVVLLIRTLGRIHCERKLY